MRFNGVLAMVLVQNIERAAQFYCEVLGFTVQEEQEDWILLQEGVSLALAPEPIPESNVNVNAVLVTLIVDDVEAAFAELTQKGVAFFLPPTHESGMVFATFRDTEGNLLQLIQLPFFQQG